MLHAAAAAEIQEAPEQMELVEARPDQENDEVPVDLSSHPPSRYLRHRPSPGPAIA
jgi:hypothetical protein